MSTRTRIRPQVALIAAVFGIATAVGGLLTWISANGPRPSMGMAHTSLSQMLVYTYRNDSSLWASVGFAVLLLGALIVVGAVTGVRTLVGIAAVGAIAAGGMWIGLVVHHYNAPTQPNSHYLNPANLPWSDLRVGAWLTLGGAVLAFVSAFLLRQRTAEVDSLETVSVA